MNEKCCILTSNPAKHAIPKTVEVEYSVSQLWEEIALMSLADNMGQGKNPTVQSQTDALEEGDLWTASQLFLLDYDQNIPFQRRWKLHIPLASYEKRLCGRWTIT